MAKSRRRFQAKPSRGKGNDKGKLYFRFMLIALFLTQMTVIVNYIFIKNDAGRETTTTRAKAMSIRGEFTNPRKEDDKPRDRSVSHQTGLTKPREEKQNDAVQILQRRPKLTVKFDSQSKSSESYRTEVLTKLREQKQNDAIEIVKSEVERVVSNGGTTKLREQKQNDAIEIVKSSESHQTEALTNLREEKQNDAIEIVKSSESHQTEGLTKPREEKQNDAIKIVKSSDRYTNRKILSKGCSLTVLLIDPNLPTDDRDSPVWSTLESVASNVLYEETTCFLIQTSACISPDHGESSLRDLVRDKALPHFRDAINRGNVRVTFLDHAKYKLPSCSNFFHLNNPFMIASYWDDEFLSADSDMVLTIQGDSFLCHTLDPDNFRQWAFVGAPWPPRRDEHNNPVPPKDVCHYIKKNWRHWTKKEGPQPDNVCKNGSGPVGNGGLSLRSRTWMKKAIHTCPTDDNNFGNDPDKMLCKLDHNPPEDLYFATVLNGIGAPMPSAFEASLFSTEMILPKQVLQYYGLREGEDEKSVVMKQWDQEEGLKLYERMSKAEHGLIPIGFHKPWLYMDEKILSSEQFKEECPILKNNPYTAAQTKNNPEIKKLTDNYSNPKIQSEGCSLTVLIVEPALPFKNEDDSIWVSLDSVASNVLHKETTCFLIQISTCRVNNQEASLLANIESKAHTHFRDAIHRGNVRATFINYYKYGLPTCDMSYHHTPFMLASYWDDEFLPADSDLVLTVRKDAFLCRTLNPDKFRHWAWVSAPWHPSSRLPDHPLISTENGGVCAFMKETWARWTENQGDQLNDVCQNGSGAVGSGGLSLRSRAWLKKAIYTCPHRQNYIQLGEFAGKTTTCKLDSDPGEDLYFATVLRGIGAPMPSAFEASLFSAEMILPKDALQHYGLKEGEDEKSVVMRLLDHGNDKDLVPIGVYKPWTSIPEKILDSTQFQEDCPVLKQVKAPIPQDSVLDAPIPQILEAPIPQVLEKKRNRVNLVLNMPGK
eukprot:CAMPEP_0172521046 /NCGR_PEP_ID=MMETSP1066-20121228/292352_1 /TAXON_ID=671091 /ORGANISM="Coscinodiscus wailesii, Strain CCMP2513" /LENGTH=991 /DNA_ID=CAMNT_0013303895 /DNA_START=48 /DNA_END=3024 /DNA_ORIENTATION=-